MGRRNRQGGSGDIEELNEYTALNGLGQSLMTLCTYEKNPVLLISGEEDMICPVPTAKRWFDRLNTPQKEFAIIKNASHMANFEKPEEWNRRVISLLRQDPSEG